MTKNEFSNGFDTLLNSYSGDISIELDEYEKSFYLTQSLEQIVKGVYSNPTGNSFEVTEETRRQLDSLVRTATLDRKDNNTLGKGKFTHLVYLLPKDCWYIVYEEFDLSDSIKCSSTQIVDVLPVTHDDYNRVVRNPFRGPSSNRVLRLDKGDNGREIELVTNGVEGKYRIRYVKLPKPIILTALPSELDNISTVEGSTITVSNSPCELPELLHWDILERAVLLALTSKNLYNTKQ